MIHLKNMPHTVQYADLCVLLLSMPLPLGTPLPAAAQTFFLNVFKKATQDPNVNSIKPIYSMLSGSCRHVLSHLHIDTRHRFDRQMCNILSSNGAGQNAMLLMWCFGIVLLAEYPDHIEAKSNDSEQPVSSELLQKQWKTSSGHKLFGSTKGLYKTLTLICMNVVWAIKGQGVSRTDAVEAIRIASRILQCVGQDMRESWRTCSALAENTFQKLSEKITLPEIDQHVRLEVLCFYAMIAGQRNLRPETVLLYEQCLMEFTQNLKP